MRQIRESIVLKQALASCALATCCAIGLYAGMRSAPQPAIAQPMPEAQPAPKRDFRDFGTFDTLWASVPPPEAPIQQVVQDAPSPQPHRVVHNDICATHHLHRVDYTRNGWAYWRCAR